MGPNVRQTGQKSFSKKCRVGSRSRRRSSDGGVGDGGRRKDGHGRRRTRAASTAVSGLHRRHATLFSCLC